MLLNLEATKEKTKAYKELLHLSLLYLRYWIHNDIIFRISGTIRQTGWIAKPIYTLYIACSMNNCICSKLIEKNITGGWFCHSQLAEYFNKWSAHWNSKNSIVSTDITKKDTQTINSLTIFGWHDKYLLSFSNRNDCNKDEPNLERC